MKVGHNCLFHVLGLKHGHIQKQDVIESLLNSVITTVHDVLLDGCHADWGFGSDGASKLHGLGEAVLSGVGHIANVAMLEGIIGTEEPPCKGELSEEGGASDDFLEALDSPKVSTHPDINLSDGELCILRAHPDVTGTRDVDASPDYVPAHCTYHGNPSSLYHACLPLERAYHPLKSQSHTCCVSALRLRSLLIQLTYLHGRIQIQPCSEMLIS